MPKFPSNWCVRRAPYAAVFVAAQLSFQLAAQEPASKEAVTEAPGSEISDVAYANACGPIACYAAMRSFGKPVTLQEVADLCGWAAGERTTLDGIRRALLAKNLQCAPLRLSAPKLATLLSTGNYVAILPVRSLGPDIDHAICAVNAASDGQAILAVDYPRLQVSYQIRELESVWDGEALVVSNPTQVPWRSLLIGGPLGAAAGYAAFRAIARRPQRNVEAIK